jgi:pantetheine-phosphate adenylyltransferase
MYPGTFDPVTNGHMDIIRRSAKFLDELVVAVALNQDKGPLFSIDERVEMLRHECATVTGEATISVRPFDILQVHFARSVGANVIVRGLRTMSDFEYEAQMVGMNQKLDPEIETVFLVADPMHQAVASRLVKEIARLDGDISPYVPAEVARRLKVKVRG